MTPPAAREDIAALKRRVNIVDVVAPHIALKRRGPHEWWGCCCFHDERTPSFKVDVRTGRFHCFGCAAHGDAIDFLGAIERLDTAGAIRRLRELAGAPLPRRPSPPPPPETPNRHGHLVRAIWAEAGPIAAGTLPWRYLTETRRITVWDPDALRFHARCPWGRDRGPAILVPLRDHEGGEVVAIWRIRPTLDGPVERWGLGPMKGTAARLVRADGPELAVAEGVEDALSFTELAGVPCWAALSAGNMAVLRLPERFTVVVVVADRDPNGVGQEGAAALVRRLRAEGRAARRIAAVGCKDANDILRARRVAP